MIITLIRLSLNKKDEYINAKPFPFILLDNFFNVDYLADTIYVLTMRNISKPESFKLSNGKYVKINNNDTEETLARKILKQEHKIYPEAIKLLAEKKIRIHNRKIKTRL